MDLAGFTYVVVNGRPVPENPDFKITPARDSRGKTYYPLTRR
ncbi:MAG: hypothetical protein OXN96_19095 [Bryobacterales bacterium]|nr:hypothetical protein [Bryobacterales bacterium]